MSSQASSDYAMRRGRLARPTGTCMSRGRNAIANEAIRTDVKKNL
jgi:hypothetical protein